MIAQIDCAHANGRQEDDVIDQLFYAQDTVACVQSITVTVPAHRVIHTRVIPKRITEKGSGNREKGIKDEEDTRECVNQSNERYIIGIGNSKSRKELIRVM